MDPNLLINTAKSVILFPFHFLSNTLFSCRQWKPNQEMVNELQKPLWSVKVPKNIKNRTTTQPRNPTSGYLSEEKEKT